MAPSPPPHAYLDTCIVSGLAKGDLDPVEEAALLRILQAREAGKIDLVTSNVVSAEIARIPSNYRRAHEDICDLLARVPVAPTHVTGSRFLPDSTLAAVWREDALFAHLRNLLPDGPDAEHVFQAAQNSIRFLVTVDRATLLKHKDAVVALSQVQLVTPVEFEQAVL